MIYNQKSLYQIGWVIDTDDADQVRVAQALLRKDRYGIEPESKHLVEK